MATLRDIQQRIVAVKNTAKITQAMKMVSAAQLNRAQRAIESARPYVTKLEDLLSNLVAAVGSDYSHKLTKVPEEVKKIGLIIVSSDRGLCGSFNANLFREIRFYVQKDFQELFPGAEVELITAGKKSTDHYKKTTFSVEAKFPGIFTGLNFSSAKDIVEIATKKFVSGEYDRVFIYYNEFVNLLKQLPTIKQLLPIAAKPDTESTFNTDYIFEPDMNNILDDLLPKLVDIQMWRTLLESNAAEQAARMIAMDNATNNAKDLIDNLTMQFNKARQAAITKEMLEIVSGAEALGK